MIDIVRNFGRIFAFALLLVAHTAMSAEFSANFKGTDIGEFVNTVSKALNKTIIVDPSAKGTITVRSYDMLNEEQYYQFFLSVLEVYGYSVVTMDSGVIKVLRKKDAKFAGTKVADEAHPGVGDEIVTRVVQLQHVTARELAPLLRQLIDNAGAGHVAHYEPSNVILITGQAAVVNRLIQIIHNVDRTGDQTVETYKLEHASANEVVKLVNTLLKEEGKASTANIAKVVADERTNAVLISGDSKARLRVIAMINRLDVKQESQGNTKVVYLKYAKAENLMNILTGMSTSIQRDGGQAGSVPASTGGSSLLKNVTIKADEQTNSLVINATPDLMYELESIIGKLDIRRAQVLVEAIIAEVGDADGLNLGVQWANKNVGISQFGNLPISAIDKNSWETQSGDKNPLNDFSGLAAGIFSGNWRVLMNALSNSSKSDILATPSIVTLDNMEATFNVGQEVPVLTGSRTSTSSDNVFNTVERKTVGIKLKVTPQINEGDSVLLQIEQEVSSVAETATGRSESLGVTFDTRTVNNAVLVNSGETVVIGGLLHQTETEMVNKVPILGDIPLLGHLFRSKTKNKKKTNLMLFIRPTIIRDQNTFTSVSSTKYEQLRKAQIERKDNESWWDYPRMDSLVIPEYQSSQWPFNKVNSAIIDFYSAPKAERY